MNDKNFDRTFLKSSKGQVFVIIGVVIALALVLINIKTNFDVALKEKEIYVETNEVEIFENIKTEFRESFDIGVKKGSYNELNRTLRNFTLFMDERLEAKDLDVLYSFSNYDNSTLKVYVWNFLEREIKNVEVSQNLTSDTFTCGTIPTGQSCYNTTNASEETADYHVNVTYTDPEYSKNYTKTYDGRTGPKGNYSAVFYRLELEIAGTELTDEETARSKPV